MFLFGVKSVLKSLGYMGVAFFVSGIISAIGDGLFGAVYSMSGIIILSCICAALLSIGMFYMNIVIFYDRKTAENGKRKKGKADNIPWEFYVKLQERKPVKARRLYICLCLVHWIIAAACICVFAIYYSDIENILNVLNAKAQAKEDSAAGILIIIMLIINCIIVQILYPISMFHAVKDATCPGCGCVFSGVEDYDYNFEESSGTWYDTEKQNVRVGTLKYKDKSIGVYREQEVRYKQDYVSKSHKTKCHCVYCGHDYDRGKMSIESGEWKRC